MFKLPISKPRNYLVKDLRSPKYRMRISGDKTKYNRKDDKNRIRKEVYAYG